jgi:flagellar biosynthesis protein FlgN
MDVNQGRYISLLKQEETALEDLYGLLMQELIALKERNSESISKLADEKNRMLNKLAEIDKERQLYIESEYPHSEVTFTNEISVLSSEIEVCLDKCKKQNSINGGIIEMSQLFNEKILDIICGNYGKQTTYAATGKNTSNNNQHSIARV